MWSLAITVEVDISALHRCERKTEHFLPHRGRATVEAPGILDQKTPSTAIMDGYSNARFKA
jgi:hypothetical protein